LDQKVVFVLGAGASCEYGLPSGKELCDRVGRYLDRDFIWPPTENRDLIFPLWEAIDALTMNVADRQAAIFRVLTGLPHALSIDDFLYNHGEDPNMVTLGKLAIAAVIANAEAGSRLKGLHDRRTLVREMPGLITSWMGKLFTRLHVGVRATRVHELFDPIGVINFNYDRCFEEFMLASVQTAYSVNEQTAASVLGNLEIHHPYGKLGTLPWQLNADNSVSFGQTNALAAAADSIKTFTEQDHNPEVIQACRSLIERARIVVFLGFGYHKQNMALIKPSTGGRSTMGYCTAWKAPGGDQTVFLSRVTALLGHSPQLISTSCEDAMNNWGSVIQEALGK
jgi:hypothetical protein